MRTRMAWLTALAVATGGGLFVFSQAPTPAPLPVPGLPPAPSGAVAKPPQPSAKPAGRDPARLSPLQKQLFFSAQRGADWLQRCNRPDGRFGYVSTPALRLRNDNDHYLR